MLHGVTRGIVLDLAQRSKGLFKDILAGPEIHIKDLEHCNEAFLTSTTKLVAPIERIDGYKDFTVGPNTQTAILRELFIKHRENYFRERGA